MSEAVTPRSHPSDAMLLRYCVGADGPAFRATVAAHAAGCPRCSAVLRQGDALGGMLLADLPETPLAPGALEAVLARLDEPAPPAVTLSDLFARRTWLVAPGVRHRRLLAADGESLHIFRVAPGASLPRHDHGGDELTHVLEGSFQDETGRYQAGDAVAQGPGVEHGCTNSGTVECVCILAVTGHLRFEGLIPRVMQRVLGL